MLRSGGITRRDEARALMCELPELALKAVPATLFGLLVLLALEAEQALAIGAPGSLNVLIELAEPVAYVLAWC